MEHPTSTLLVASLLVLAGALMLGAAMRHATYLIAHGERAAVGWRSLFLLVALFIFGYAVFLYFLFETGRVASTEMVVALIFFGGGVFVMLIVKLSVVTVRHLRELARLERQHALHDTLTGLPNRMFFNEEAARTIQLAQRGKAELAVLVMDLNRFKEINDTLGHEAGDQLLAGIAPRLRECVRASDLVCRMGGDEFVLLLYGSGAAEAALVAQKIAERVRMPVAVAGNNLSIGASIGIAVWPEHGKEIAALLRRADIAMYESKRRGADFWMYEAKQDREFMRRLMLAEALREAIEHERLALVYQPRVDLRTRKPQGAEALLRWLHPELGIIPPEVFIPLAEQTGLIRSLTFWVLESVLRQMLEWERLGIELDVSVNVSVRNLSDRDFPAAVGRLLEATAITPSRLTLEVTESSMIVNPETTHEVLRSLAKLGVRISIDDFGTGFSSMQYLKRLPACEVKVDKGFVMNMLENESDAVIVHATIAMAHNLGYKVVAEGVDNQEVLDLLEILDCDAVQGFLVSRPIPPESLCLWLAAYQQKPNIRSRAALA